MSSVLDLVEALAELFTWIGFILGGLCFLALFIVRSVHGSWEETEAVVVDAAGVPELRWMTTDGTLHSRVLEPDEIEMLPDPDQLHIHYNRRSPQRIRFDATAHGEKLLRALGLIFLGVGVFSLIVSLVALFLPR